MEDTQSKVIGSKYQTFIPLCLYLKFVFWTSKQKKNNKCLACLILVYHMVKIQNLLRREFNTNP